MNRNDFRNPLIQSGIILLFAFFLIGAVASSPASGFFSGIYAMIIAILKGIAFLFGLSISLIFSIAVLIGIYLITLYFKSPEQAQSIAEHLKSEISELVCKLKSCRKEKQDTPETTEDDNADTPGQNGAAAVQKTVKEDNTAVLEKRIFSLEKKSEEVRSSLDASVNMIKSLEDKLAVLANTAEEPSDEITALTSSTETLTEELAAHKAAMETLTGKIESVEQQISNEIPSIKTEIDELRELSSTPEMVSGILSYLDKPEERENLTKKVEEAVSRGMTYTQADEFFKKSLPAKIYKILADHPRLTKDFIRSIKKKFA